jgi:squalene-hopene/tetraprenyl-beta-curcumene cyclase
VQAPKLAPGGWAFQYQNPYFPDLDDTAAVAGVLHLLGRDGQLSGAVAGELRQRLDRAADWLVGLQSDNGGFGAYDKNNTHYWINRVPFADHGAMLDPPTEDVTGRVLSFLGLLRRDQDCRAIRRGIAYLKKTQQPDGCWWGRWGTNYVYGTWSALGGLMLAGEDPQAPYIRRAVAWLEAHQHADGGWGETCDSYLDPRLRGSNGGESTPNATAWALLGLLAAGECGSAAVERGISCLIEAQQRSGSLQGLWHHRSHNAPGFPRVFYLKYHGYTAYFPLWALARYRCLRSRSPASA